MIMMVEQLAEEDGNGEHSDLNSSLRADSITGGLRLPGNWDGLGFTHPTSSGKSVTLTMSTDGGSRLSFVVLLGMSSRS